MKKVWPFLFYFFFYVAGAGLFPYFALYYQSIGLSGAEIGLLTGMSPLITLISAPFWTGIADATHHHKLILSLTLIGVIATALIIPSLHGFAVLLPFVLLYAFVGAPAPALGDSATMSMLGDEREMYGRVRLGGTIGWGVMAYFAGVLIDRHGITWAFWIYAVGMALTLLVSQGLKFDRVEKQGTFWNGVSTLIADRRWLLFLGMAFICGVGMASVNTYQFMYMAEIGASKSLMGLSLTISTVSELPVMFFGDRLLKRFKAQGLLTLGMAAISIRVLLYAAFNFPIAILIIQLIQGLTFPAIWIAGVSYAHEHAPAGLKATGQGLFSAMMMGFGSGVGGLLGGLLIGNYGGRIMYLVFGILILICLILFKSIERFVPSDAHAQTETV
jgi:MFS transporter, PPP family, 3-phenylpropionic acid transporter